MTNRLTMDDIPKHSQSINSPDWSGGNWVGSGGSCGMYNYSGVHVVNRQVFIVNIATKYLTNKEKKDRIESIKSQFSPLLNGYTYLIINETEDFEGIQYHQIS